MTGEYWASRYNSARLPPAALRLKAPLTRAWKYRRKGVAPGFLRAGNEAVFTNSGKAQATRLDLTSGKPVWIDPDKHGASLITRWKSDLLVYGEGHLRALEWASGAVIWDRECRAGLQTAFVVDDLDLLVGELAEGFHVIDLNTVEYLWKVPELASNPLVSDGSVVIRADDDITCYDLRTGAVRWSRRGPEFGGEQFGGKAWGIGFIWRDLFVVSVGWPILLRALEVATGRTVWEAEFDSKSWPYGDRTYGFDSGRGVYSILDLSTGKVVFEKFIGKTVPAPVRGEKSGLIASVRGQEPESWRATVAVSETHAFLTNASGQIVVLARDTGEVEQVVEIDGMPAGFGGPVIYENRLLLTDFNAAVYCFQGAG